MNRVPNALVRAAAANVRHGRVDVCVAGGRVELEKGDNRHDHPLASYGATVAAAKAGTSPEFLVQRREPSAPNDSITHAIFRVSDLAATVAAAKAAGATMKDDVVSVPIGGVPVKIAMLVDPDGNMLELMELPKGAERLPHP